MRSVRDMMGNDILIPHRPQKIISLVPSISETLADYQLDSETIGITKFCIHPKQWFESKTRIGGTKDPKLELIASLEPDLVIGNKEENRKEDIEWLQQRFPVYVSDVNNLEDNETFLRFIDSLTSFKPELRNFTAPCPAVRQAKSVLYLIWKGPWMGVASNTYIDRVMAELNFSNCLVQDQRYPELDLAKMEALQPDYVFYSSEPFPFQEKHMEELKTILPNSQHILVDGECFSWFGLRWAKSFPYFQSLIERIEKNN